MNKNDRAHALSILKEIITHQTPISTLLNKYNPSALTKDLCFGVCRYYFFLDKLAQQFVKKKPKPKEVWLGILLGLYQLEFQSSPDYAVVKETVALFNTSKLSFAKPLINGVLRQYCRYKQTNPLASSTAENFVFDNHPQWFINKVKKAWPSDYRRILTANDEHPPMSLRVNTDKISRQAYLDLLKDSGIQASPTIFSEQGIRLMQATSVFELPHFKDGYVSVQDEAAQLTYICLQLKKGHRVLDACCAPGGKLAHALEQASNQLDMIGLDIEHNRLKRVSDNLARLQLQANLKQADASCLSEWWDNIPFDRILLDAPCSATGVIRRNPDIKLSRTENDISAITQKQQILLHALWPTLKPQGLLIYATCSIFPEENENQIKAFVESHDDCAVITIDAKWGLDTGWGRQIFPGDNQMDGFFYSILTKRCV